MLIRSHFIILILIQRFEFLKNLNAYFVSLVGSLPSGISKFLNPAFFSLRIKKITSDDYTFVREIYKIYSLKELYF